MIPNATFSYLSLTGSSSFMSHRKQTLVITLFEDSLNSDCIHCIHLVTIEKFLRYSVFSRTHYESFKHILWR